jgi:transposase-like protein
MAAGDITFIQCPQGDSFPVQKTASRSLGAQQVICPRCGRSFEVKLEETVERPSAKLGLRLAVTRFA